MLLDMWWLALLTIAVLDCLMISLWLLNKVGLPYGFAVAVKMM
jgi:hypothetical protein